MDKYIYWIKTITKCPICGSQSTNWTYAITEYEEEAYEREVTREEYCRGCERDFKGH